MSNHTIIMPLEEIMGDRFGRYSKYIIQDRALPDVRDGLKPVQRRILYAMYKEGNVYTNPYRKSAKTVGVVIGNYHPHGDSSVYDAMVRMSQDWKMGVPLIDIQGNNGSIDNDPAAAMRYTEARLSKIAVELLRDLDKNTCAMSLNFDDTEYEPTVLPAKFPNLLVNGSTGISAGYATDIPPHNFAEVIDGTIYRIKHPNCQLDDIMTMIKGPDFPTGAIVEGVEGIRDAFTSGKGKVVVRAKTCIQEQKNINQIIISEIPYEVNKAELCRRIDEIRFNHSIDGILEVRDESDREGLSIVIDLKKEAPAQNILNYLYKNTDLQKNYNYNMVAICDKRPLQLGLLAILDAYINHQIEVVTRRSIYEQEKAKERLHIVEGLIKANDIIDEVVAVIRQSNDKADAKNRLVTTFDFTLKQAEAIVMLQLYRLTNTDIKALQEEMRHLSAYLKELDAILNDDRVLRNVIIKELKEVKALYPSPRKTEICAEVMDVVVDKEAMIIPEDVYVSITKDGYVKKISLRSYKQSAKAAFGMKEDDTLLKLDLVNTLDKLLLFTNKGNYLYVPVHELEEFKWRDLGKHISYLVKVDSEEKIVSSLVVREFRDDLYVLLTATSGQTKRVLLRDFDTVRYTKPMKCFNLKDDDELMDATFTNHHQSLLYVSKKCRYMLLPESSISIQGLRAGGIRSFDFGKDQDTVVSVITFDPQTSISILFLNTKGHYRKIKASNLEVTRRNTKGLTLVDAKVGKRETIFGAYIVDSDSVLEIQTIEDPLELVVKDCSYSYTLNGGFNKNIINQEIVSIYQPAIIKEAQFDVVIDEYDESNDVKYEKIALPI